VWGFTAEYDYYLEQSGDLSVLAPALAIDVTNRLSLGLAVNVWNDSVTGSSEYHTDIDFDDTVTMPFPPFTFTTPMSWRFETKVDDGYSLAMGGLYRVSKQWAVGAVLKPAYTLSLEEKRDTGAGPIHDQIEIEMPWSVGAGVAWRPNDPLTLSLDVSWTDWSKYVLDDWDDVERNPLTDDSIRDDKCEDTIAVRLGLEYLLVREATVIPLRAGLGYDGAPAVGEVDNHYTASIGVGYQRGRFMADLAYEYRWGRDLTGGGVWGYLEPSEDAERHRLLLSLIVYL